jgi:hypothetical protein
MYASQPFIAVHCTHCWLLLRLRCHQRQRVRTGLPVCVSLALSLRHLEEIIAAIIHKFIHFAVSRVNVRTQLKSTRPLLNLQSHLHNLKMQTATS